MTTEQRENSVKVAKGIAEDFKVSMRNIRKESNDKVKKLLKDKEITEDESKTSPQQNTIHHRRYDSANC